MQSYPTPAGATNTEWMNSNFLKLHAGPPIHYFLACEDEFFHTHPFRFTTHIIVGGYTEEVLVPQTDGSWKIETFERKPGTSHVMEMSTPHKLTGLLNGPCITRCEYGPTQQKPGFCRFDKQGRLLFRYWDENEWRPFLP